MAAEPYPIIGRTTLSSRRGPPRTRSFTSRREVKVAVASEQGREAVVAILDAGSFFGEGCLIGQPLRLARATAMTNSSVMRVGKGEMVRVLRAEPTFGEMFMSYLLTRN